MTPLEAEIRRAKPADIGKILAGFNKAPKGTPLHALAKKAEDKAKRLATRKSHRSTSSECEGPLSVDVARIRRRDDEHVTIDREGEDAELPRPPFRH